MEPRRGGNGRGVVKESLCHGGSVMSTLPPIEKQGHIGDIHEKSKVELMELLERQEKMLKNRKFIQRLPDQGEKIRNFVRKLEDLISKKNQEDTRISQSVMTSNTNENLDKTNFGLSELSQRHEDELKIMERGFEKLSVHEGPHYQVIVKAGERNVKKSKFSLNRPHKKENTDASVSNGSEGHPKPNVKRTELTSASVHDPDHGPATLITVQECRSLQSEQRKKVQEFKAQRIADRFMQRMNAGVGLNHPEEGVQLEVEKENSVNLDQNFLDSVD